MPFGAILLVTTVSAFILVVVPLLLHYRHERWKLRLEHERQLRALDLGRNFPGSGYHDSWFSPIRAGMIIGAAVPLGAFLSAMVTSVCIGFHEGTWIATGMVGLGSVISGSCLVGHACRQSKMIPAEGYAKPYVEEDAYDVVSARA
jgi:hypothetical protein